MHDNRRYKGVLLIALKNDSIDIFLSLSLILKPIGLTFYDHYVVFDDCRPPTSSGDYTYSYVTINVSLGSNQTSLPHFAHIRTHIRTHRHTSAHVHIRDIEVTNCNNFRYIINCTHSKRKAFSSTEIHVKIEKSLAKIKHSLRRFLSVKVTDLSSTGTGLYCFPKLRYD